MSMPGRPGTGHRHQTDGPDHRAPSDCPVCGEHLVVTRLGCESCGTELAGIFAPCEFCALSAAELDMLRVFLAARGNLREVEKHLGVSYPTARARFTEVLQKMGLAESDEPKPAAGPPGQGPSREQILAEVASGALTPAEAASLLAG
ncbi:DUF2089 domain-containing protein [Microlunatus soli]|uniref:DUF2089 domain-containing protein n=1 Tax=Microlunatus soli TaxID=630515 RepID=A0A1H1QPG5_9ACTN|nr:DUF2089 domain-containing protein [Microlunatus soli]SDS25233.1 hypothetical protein SAMN04489812_1339 [Microlunatus soli]